MAVINERTQKLLKERYFKRDRNTGEIIEHTAEEMFRRVASVVSKAEKTPELQKKWEEKFYEVMDRQLFMPNTPTLIGAGYNRCLSACSVIGRIPDSLEGIYQYMWYNAKLTKYGCGVGQDLSDIRPKGEIIKSSGGASAGVVNWMHLINTVAATTIQGDKARRAANIVTLRFNHPDIFDFIHSKQEDKTLSNMNISVVIKDEEMQKVINDEDIDLVWNGKVYQTVKAREIFNEIIDGLWSNGEPGLLFIDTINKANPFNLQDGKFDETNPHYMFTSNPCGEQVLESFELCNLGSINLENLYNEQTNDVDWDLFKDTIRTGIRFLDDVIDVNEYVLPQFKEKVLGNRKIGLGVCGFANLLIKLGIQYDSQEALDFIDKLFGFKKKVEEEYNTELALEKGNFPNWSESIYAKKNIPARCATVSTQAPTGSISSILNTTAYGIEPLFGVAYLRRIVTGEFIEANELFKSMLHGIINDAKKEQEIIEQCYKAGTTQLDCVPDKLRKLFRCANDIDPIWHVKIQAQIQKYYDNAISKTINAPEYATKDELYDLLVFAWKNGLKGLTYYRNNSRSSQTIQIGQKNNQEVLNRGDVIKAPDEADGRTYKFVSGCGNVYLNVTWDKDGNINQTFTNKGSSGTCRSNQEAVSRLISLALRGGIPIEKIIDQLESVDICPAYTVARAKGKKVSKGASCPHAIANILKKAINDVQVKVNKSQNEQLVENKIDNVQDKNICPECGSSITQAEGCVLCKNCGWSKCD